MNRKNAKIKLLPTALFYCLLLHIALAQTTALQHDERVERAIDRGLAFIAESQNENGSFDPMPNFEPGVTGLCAMAFLAKGYLPGEPPYGEVLNKAVDYILANYNKATGTLGSGNMYSHTIATLFLSELSGMLDEKRQHAVDEALPKAVQVILSAQRVKKVAQHQGGWRYNPGSVDSDMSVSGWALMALRSSRLNGAPVPSEAIENAVEYVLRHHDPKAGGFGYQDTTRFVTTLTGAGVLCLELSGQHGHPATKAGARFLMTSFKTLPSQTRCFYGMYYTAQGLFQIGGDEWQTFSEWMYDYWIPRQLPDGSWDRGESPSGPYQTAMVVLSFAVPYRQLPIYQRDETIDETW